MDSFLWIPCKGIDAAALKRLQSHFPRPKEPMGEAWFMSEERRMYPELLGDLSTLPMRELEIPLSEISSGTSAFGPMEEWDNWYHYLLAQTLPRAHDAYVNSLLESLVTGFMAIYPNGVYSAPYKQFREDVITTLGRCIMEPSCWVGSEIAVGQVLHRSNNNPNRVWCWWDASGDFSSSMFFCLKYLPEELVGNWLRSVLAIRSPHWRAQVLVWLVGTHDLLTGAIDWPSQFDMDAAPAVHWVWSHCIGPGLAEKDASGAGIMRSFITESVRSEVLGLVRLHFTEDVFLEWLESISTVSYLESELGQIPSQFESLFVRKRP
jgi:hypothetical protein